MSKQNEFEEVGIAIVAKDVGKFVRKMEMMELAIGEVRHEVDKLTKSVERLLEALPKTKLEHRCTCSSIDEAEFAARVLSVMRNAL